MGSSLQGNRHPESTVNSPTSFPAIRITSPPDEPAYSSILYESLIILLFAREDAEPNEEDSIVEQAKRYIQRNISDNLTIQSVSQSMGLSSSYFSWLFKRETGYSHVPVPANEFLLLQA